MDTLQDDTSRWLRDSQLHTHIVKYFRDMFSSRQERSLVDFLLYLEGRIREEMNENLSKEFLAEEIVIALKKCTPTRHLAPI